MSIQKSILIYINRLEGFKTAIKNLHWSATKMTEHEFLDKLEDLVSDHQDEVAEITQGSYGLKIKNNELIPKKYKIQNTKNLVKAIVKSCEDVYSSIQSNKRFIGLRSVIEDFLGQMNKQSYLVNMVVESKIINQSKDLLINNISMKRKTTKSSIQETRDFLNKIRNTMHMLSEAYVYDDMEGDNEGEYDDNEAIAMGQQEEMQKEDEGKQYVDSIRQAALKGIQYFAENVDDPNYIFFKKVFMMADKVLSEKEEGNSDSNV